MDKTRNTTSDDIPVITVDQKRGNERPSYYMQTSFNQKPGLGPSFNQDPQKMEFHDAESKEETETSVCNSIIQCSQETSFAGLKYIGGVDSSNFRRLCWLLVVLGALTGLTFQLYRSTEKFISYDTNTNFKYVPKDELDFPSVTFCNTNMFRVDKLVTIYGSWDATLVTGLRYIRQLFPQLGITVEEEFNPDLIDEEYPGGLSLYDFVMSSAHKAQSMIKLCEYRGQPCSAENFTTQITNFGVCFTFNSHLNNESLTVNTAGQRQGLSLLLDDEEQEAISAPRENTGFKMLVHPRGEVPNLQDFGIELQPGTHTPVRLDVTQMTTLGEPYGRCGERLLKYYDGEYTESKCFLECETDYIVSICGCRNFYMPGNARYCSPTQLIYCFYNTSDVFSANKHKLCSCPEACKETIYKPTISQSSFPSRSVSLALTARGNYYLTAAAFTQAVTGGAGAQIQELYEWLAASLYYEITLLTDSNNATFLATFPSTIDVLTATLMRYVYGNINYDLYFYLANWVFYQVVTQTVSIEYGSTVYYETYNNDVEKYVNSGIYNQSVKKAFQESGEYVNYNATLEDFVDYVYDEFDFEDIFHFGYPWLYNETLDILLKKGYELSSTDLDRMTTTFLSRRNLHVDVFFGDLKVEQITEQPSYEFFQFICDIGGALGLFFGASLLSFIETADFWWTNNSCCSSKKDKDRKNKFGSKSQVKVQP